MTVRRQGELAGVSVLIAGDAHLQEVTHGIILSFTEVICPNTLSIIY